MWKCLSCKIIWILRILFFNVFVYFYDCYVVSNVCIVCFCLGCYKMRSWKRHEIDPQHHLLLFPLEKERVWNNLENSFFMTLHHYFFYASQTQTPMWNDFILNWVSTCENLQAKSIFIPSRKWKSKIENRSRSTNSQSYLIEM